MKRVTALILCLALLLIIPACTPAMSRKPVSLTIWHYYNGVQKLMLDEMLDQFNQTVGVKNNIVAEAFSHGPVAELHEHIMHSATNRVGAENLPSMFASYADNAYALDKMGLAADVSSYFTQEELDQFVPSFLNEGRFSDEGGIKIFPTAKSTEILMVNKTDWDKFALATGASQDGLKTWEGIAAIAKSYYEWTDSLTPVPDDGKAFFGRDAMANYMLVGSAQLGTPLFAVSPSGQASFHLDRTIMRRLWDNYYVPYVNGYYAAVSRFRSDDAKTGEIIALVCSTSGGAYFPSSVTIGDNPSYPVEAQVLPPPNFEGTAPYAVQQGAGMVVLKSDSASEQAAITFLKWFTQQEQNLLFTLGSGYLPVKKASLEAILEGDALDQQTSDELLPILRQVVHVGAQVVSGCTLYTPPVFDSGSQARTLIEQSMQARADADRAAVLALMSDGVPRQQAVDQYVNDQSFNDWFDELFNQLSAIIAN